MQKNFFEEFLYFGVKSVIFFSNNQDFNQLGHLFMHMFSWFQLDIVNCHPGWLSNLCFIWKWRFRLTFKNLIFHHLEISRGPPLLISSCLKISRGFRCHNPLEFSRTWKYTGPGNIQGTSMIQAFEICRISRKEPIFPKQGGLSQKRVWHTAVRFCSPKS